MIYEGNWHLDSYDGYGILYYNNQDKIKYMGTFQSGYPYEGKLFDKTGKIVHEGFFDDYYNFDLQTYDGVRFL